MTAKRMTTAAAETQLKAAEVPLHPVSRGHAVTADAHTELAKSHLYIQAIMERNAHMNTSTLDPAEDRQGAGKRYRFEHLTLPLVLKDLYFTADDPGPGDRVPAFDLPTVGGGRFRSRDLAKGPALLIFGSSTCPMTDSAAPGLNELHIRFGSGIRFVMVNVREAHPGKAFPQPQTFEAKMAHAARLRELHGFVFDVAVDDLTGTLHRALAPKPNSAYIAGADGTILFRAHWANDTAALAAALTAVAAGEPPSPARSGGLVRAMLRMVPHLAPVLDRAGGGAWGDMWRVAPPLAALALALKAARRWPRRADAFSSWIRGDL